MRWLLAACLFVVFTMSPGHSFTVGRDLGDEDPNTPEDVGDQKLLDDRVGPSTHSVSGAQTEGPSDLYLPAKIPITPDPTFRDAIAGFYQDPEVLGISRIQPFLERFAAPQLGAGTSYEEKSFVETVSPELRGNIYKLRCFSEKGSRRAIWLETELVGRELSDGKWIDHTFVTVCKAQLSEESQRAPSFRLLVRDRIFVDADLFRTHNLVFVKWEGSSSKEALIGRAGNIGMGDVTYECGYGDLVYHEAGTKRPRKRGKKKRRKGARLPTTRPIPSEGDPLLLSYPPGNEINPKATERYCCQIFSTERKRPSGKMSVVEIRNKGPLPAVFFPEEVR